MRCKKIVDIQKTLSNLWEGLTRNKKIIAILSIIALSNLLLIPFFPMFALKMGIGILSLAFSIPFLLAVFWFIFPITYKVGTIICETFGWDDTIDPIEDGPVGIFRWVIGIVLYAIPFGLYGFGALINSLFHLIK